MSNVKKVLFVGISQFSGVLINFILLSFLSRNLTYHENSTIFQTFLYADFFYNIFNVGIIGNIYVIIAKYIKDESTKSTLFPNLIFILLILSVLAILILVGLRFPIADLLNNPDIAGTLLLYWPIIPITIFSNCFSYINLYYGRAKVTSITALAASFLKLALIFGLVYLGKLSILNILIAYLASQTFTLAVNLIVFLKNNEFEMTKKLDKAMLKDFVIMSYPLGITGVLGFGYALIAGTLISHFMTTTDYAIYRNGSIELPFIGTVVTSITMIYLPIISNLVAENKMEEVISIKQRLNNIVAAIVYPIIAVIIFLAKDLILLLLSAKYVLSIPVFIVFTCILFLRITDYQDILVSAKKSKVVLVGNILFVVINIFLVLVGIKLYGVLGASIGVLLSVAILAFFLTYKTSEHLKIRIKELIDYEKIGFILAICMVLGIPFFFFADLLILKITYAALYVLACYWAINKLGIADIKELIVKVIGSRR